MVTKIKRTRSSIMALTAASVFLFAGCNNNKAGRDNNEGLQRYEMKGVSITAPVDTAMKVIRSSDNELLFTKQAEISLTSIHVKIFRAEIYHNDETFLRFAEDYLQNELQRLEMLSIHFNGTKVAVAQALTTTVFAENSYDLSVNLPNSVHNKIIVF